jgi:hypothetical protein
MSDSVPIVRPLLLTRAGPAQEAPAAAQDPAEHRGVNLVPEEEPRLPGDARRHVLGIGLDEYEDPGDTDLSCAARDARDIADRNGVRREAPDRRMVLKTSSESSAVPHSLVSGLRIEDCRSNSFPAALRGSNRPGRRTTRVLASELACGVAVPSIRDDPGGTDAVVVVGE